jgi:ParB/RepB/Spo0J family partition protein
LDANGYSALREDMRVNGQRTPVELRQIGADAYELLDGQNRWQIALELNWGELESIVTTMSDDQADVANFVLNAARGRMNPVKAAMLFDEDRKRGLAEEGIGRKYNLSQQRISQILVINSYPEDIKRLLTNRLVTEAHVRAILSSTDDPELQLKAAEKVVSDKLSVKEAAVTAKGLLEEKLEVEKRARRKDEMLDFSAINGEWRASKCEHLGRDSFCKKWYWSDEPIYLKKRLPWLEMRNVRGRWFIKASSGTCALCGDFAQRGARWMGFETKLGNWRRVLMRSGPRSTDPSAPSPPPTRRLGRGRRDIVTTFKRDIVDIGAGRANLALPL